MIAELNALTGDAGIAEGLDAYFNVVSEWGAPAASIGLLSAQSVIEQSREFRTFHPVVQRLQGIILDDPGTSDHHIVLCRAGVAGSVLHLAHDGTSRIVFDNIRSFLEAARRAAALNGLIEDEHPRHARVLSDQVALRGLIEFLRSDPDYDDIVPALVPSLELSDPNYLSTLVVGEDVYVAEAVCQEITARPSADLMPVVETGEAHAHWMVRNAAASARERIANLPST